MSYSHETIERFNTARSRMIRLRTAQKLPLTALRCFEAAARHGSFTRAAEELHLTQGAVSRQVQTLERRIGVQLFERSGRRIALSLEGQLLARATTDALERLGEAICDLTGPGKVITISMLPSIAACWLAPRMAKFAAAHPRVELRLSASRHLVDFHREGIDAAIRYGAGKWPEVTSELLATEQVFPVCSPGYAVELMLKAPRDLQRATLLHSDNPDSWQDWLAAAGCADLPTGRGVYMDEDTTLLRAAADGEGIALGRSLLVADDVAEGRLVSPFDIRIPATFSYWFVTPLKARGGEENLELVRAWLMTEFKTSLP